MSEWIVEKAPSARAKCRTCKAVIAKGQLRWGKVFEHPSFGTTKQYQHVACLRKPKFELEEAKGLDELSPEEQKEARDAFANATTAAATPKKAKKEKKEKAASEDPDGAAPAVKKAKGKRNHPQLEVERKGKKVKRDETGQAVDEDPVVQKYNKLKISELKEYLQLNKALRTGTKGELVARCVDGEKNGRLKPCPQCGKGMLRQSERGTVACGGYFDDTISIRIPCNFETEPSNAPRGKWLVPGVDEDPDAEDGNGAAGSARSEVSDADLSKVRAAFDKLGDDARPKDVAKLLVKTGRQMGLQLPEDEAGAMQRAGTALMSHRDGGNFDVVAAFKQLHAECGTQAEAAKREEMAKLAAPKAKTEANTTLAAALDELATLEAKVQESPNFQFKVRALRTAANAIRSCAFAVTSGKQISAGKTKLPGVGKSTGTLVDEWLQSGAVARLDELREKVAKMG